MPLLETILAKLIGAERRLAPHAFDRSGYSFTQDYVSHLAALWNLHLGELRGRAGLRALEIGSFEGRSAIWLLENILTDPTSTVTCVDVFVSRMSERRFDHNLAVSGQAHRAAKIRARSQEVLPLLRPDSFELIYVDGSHRADDVRADARLSWPLLKVGGILVFDDYRWHLEKPIGERPAAAIDEFLAEFGGQIEILHKDGQVIVRKTVPSPREPG